MSDTDTTSRPSPRDLDVTDVEADGADVKGGGISWSDSDPTDALKTSTSSSGTSSVDSVPQAHGGGTMPKATSG